jgi:hypothetical protein
MLPSRQHGCTDRTLIFKIAGLFQIIYFTFGSLPRWLAQADQHGKEPTLTAFKDDHPKVPCLGQRGDSCGLHAHYSLGHLTR